MGLDPLAARRRRSTVDEALVGAEKAAALVERILDNGLEPFRQPPLLPPISEDDIDLICWMVLSPTAWYPDIDHGRRQ